MNSIDKVCLLLEMLLKEFNGEDFDAECNKKTLCAQCKLAKMCHYISDLSDRLEQFGKDKQVENYEG